MAESKFKKFLNAQDFIEKLSKESGIQLDKDMIAICLYKIMLDQGENAEAFIDGKILIDDVPYSSRLHGDLRNVAKRFLRNQDAFQFDDSFIDILLK